jgi:GNAT superfamily N-acetyltransferase
VTTVEAVDPLAPGAFDEWFDVLHATDLERWPDRPGWQRPEIYNQATDATEATPLRLFLARDADGHPVGTGGLGLPRLENQTHAYLEVRVLPEARRRHVGRSIVEAATMAARSAGRAELGGRTEVPTRSGFVDASVPFAEALGFSVGQHVALRQLSVPLPPARTAALESDARAHPAGYSMLTFHDRWPDEHMEDRCELARRMSTDIPMGELELDEEIWDAARVRAMEAALAAMNRSKVSTSARHEESGRLVGYSEIAVPLGAPESVWQHDTLVMREHRGHGLGFALKVANLAALMSAHPAVRRISTFNAAENEHMIAVNEDIGFKVAAEGAFWKLDISG